MLARLTLVPLLAVALATLGGGLSSGSGAGAAGARVTTPALSATLYTSGLATGARPENIITGPDDNLWFSDYGTTPAIGRITPVGVITEYSTGLNAGSRPTVLMKGPDGNL